MSTRDEASLHHAIVTAMAKAYAEVPEDARRQYDHSALYAAVAFLLEHLKDDKLQDSADFLSGQLK